MDKPKLDIRLRLASQIIDRIKPEEIKYLRDAFNVGASQTGMLRSWSTDKTDKNPLITTMDRINSPYPILATITEELKDFPDSLIGKIKEGDKIVDLQDARINGTVRVKKEALNWWLTKGNPCNDETLASVKMLYGTDIRKNREYHQTTFNLVNPADNTFERKRIQTELPFIAFHGNISDVFITLFEDFEETGSLSKEDKKVLNSVQEVIMPQLGDPTEIVNLIRKMTDRKMRYVPKTRVKSMSAVEMRHALEQNHWSVTPTNLPLDSINEYELLRNACSFIIDTAMKFGGSSKRTLVCDLIKSTYFFNEPLENKIRNEVEHNDLSLNVCKACLGEQVVKSFQLKGCVFVEKQVASSSIEGIFKQPTFEFVDASYKKREVDANRVWYNLMMYSFRIKTGLQSYHSSLAGVTCEIEIDGRDLKSLTFFGVNKRIILRMLGIIITKFALCPSYPILEADDNRDFVCKCCSFFSKVENMPFEKRRNVTKRIKDEVIFEDIPSFKDVYFLNHESSSFKAPTISVEVRENDLALIQKLGYGVEEYSRELIDNKSIVEYVVNKHGPSIQLPMEIFSHHHLLLNRLTCSQKLVKFLMVCFENFISRDKGMIEISYHDSDMLRTLFPFSFMDDDSIKKYLDKSEYMLSRVSDSFQKMIIEFSIIVCKTLRDILSTGDLPFKRMRSRSKIVFSYVGSDIFLNIQDNDYSIILPTFNAGTVKIDEEGVLRVNNMAIFNLMKNKILLGDIITQRPILEKCCILGDHSSVEINSFSEAYSLKGHHVKLRDFCFVVKSLISENSIVDICESIKRKQALLTSSIINEYEDYMDEDIDVD